MALYTFTVEGFHIDATRALGDDNNQVACGLRIGSHTFPAQSMGTGDVDGGDFPIGLVFGPFFVNQAGTPVALSYSIYNGDASRLPSALNQWTSNLADKAVESLLHQNAPEPADISDYTDFPNNPDSPPDANLNFADSSWIQVLEFAALGNFLFPDCDGFVAIGTIGKSKLRWDTLVDMAGGLIYRQRIRYPGTDSPTLCGGTSDYSVTWSVKRDRVGGPGPHSLRQFLLDHHLTLNPGIRSLAPGESTVSVKGLMT